MELNEASLIESEFTVRNLRLPKEVMETRRSAIRWLALSLGILNPGESRLSAIAVLDAMVYFQFVKNYDPTVKDLVDYINKNWEGMNEKTLRYHLLQMKKMGFVENSQAKFYFRQPSVGDRFDVDNWVTQMLDSQYKQVAVKIGEVLKDLKSKNAFEGIK